VAIRRPGRSASPSRTGSLREPILFHDNLDNQDVNANLFTVRFDGTGLWQLTFADDRITRYLGAS
jgi:hypothetical protein